MPPGGYTKGSKIGCTKCRKYVVGGVSHDDDRGRLLISGHYDKVFYWTYYMENNCTHTGKTMGEDFIPDGTNGTAGIENYITANMLADPGAFIDWTVANVANGYLDADDENYDAAIRKKYSYDGSDTVEGFTVVPKTCTLGTEVTRILCKQAADYLLFDHEGGQATGSLRVIVQDKHTAGDGCISLSFTGIVVNVIRVNADGSFKDVTKLTADGGYGGPGNRYVVPGVYGTDYDKAIIVITEYSSSAGGDGDVYKYGATGSLP